MELETVRLTIPEGVNLIVGQAHFIKTVEDLYEVLATTAPQAQFGVAFNEASGERLIRHEGNSKPMRQLAVRNARAVGAGHLFVIALKDAFPIQVLPRIRDCHEVVRIFCATANPVEVIVAQTELGRGVVGVIDGQTPLGAEKPADIAKREDLLRKIGYKK